MSQTDEQLYLNVSAVQSGDVLLTLGDGPISKWIARATGGPYSHAAVVIAERLLFESDDHGIGPTTRSVDRVERHPNELRFLSRLVGVKKAVLLRHPKLHGQLKGQRFQDLLLEISEEPHGKEYPEWPSLASAARGGALGRLVALGVLRIMAKRYPEEVVNGGMFCSQLVAAMLTEAFSDISSELSLFGEVRPAASVNPNSFLRSQLTAVPDGVVRASDDSLLDPNWMGEPNDMKGSPRAETTGVHVKLLASAKRADIAFRALQKTADSTFSSMREIMRKHLGR